MMHLETRLCTFMASVLCESTNLAGVFVALCTGMLSIFEVAEGSLLLLALCVSCFGRSLPGFHIAIRDEWVALQLEE